VVLPYRALMNGQTAECADFLQKVRHASRPLALKVIIESGVLASPALIPRPHQLSPGAGADFIKTSTGKTPVSATPEAATVMLREIAAAASTTAGFKASGGIRSVPDAKVYLDMAAATLGADALTASAFALAPAACSTTSRPCWRVRPRRPRPTPTDTRRHTACWRRKSSAPNATASASPAQIQHFVQGWSTAAGAKARWPRWPWPSSGAAWAATRRGADPRHDATRAACWLARHARPGAGQALHRRRGRQDQPDAGAHGGGLRRLCADDLRPRPGPHRRHAGQARGHARLQRRPDAACV
jgi:hypothetical protein